MKVSLSFVRTAGRSFRSIIRLGQWRGEPRVALVLAAIALVLIAGAAHAATRTPERLELAAHEVLVWWPVARGPRPVLVFSHGFNGCADQASFLMNAFANAGYLVLAPQHDDALCDGRRRGVTEPEAPFGEPEGWTPDTFGERARDVTAILAAARRDARFRHRADWSRLGLIGHSLGGYTVLGMAGAWPSWPRERVRAVLAVSPGTRPFLLHGSLENLRAAVMYQGGTRDRGPTPSLRREGGAYDRSPPPRYYVEFEGADHMAWTDSETIAHALIVRYAVAFMDRYVKGSAPADILVGAPPPGVSAYRYDSELGRR